MASEESTDADTPADDESVAGPTDDAQIRVWWLSTAATLIVLLSFIGILVGQAIGVAEPPSGNAWGTFTMIFVLFSIYVVGPGTVEAYQKLKGD